MTFFFFLSRCRQQSALKDQGMASYIEFAAFSNGALITPFQTQLTSRVREKRYGGKSSPGLLIVY